MFWKCVYNRFFVFLRATPFQDSGAIKLNETVCPTNYLKDAISSQFFTIFRFEKYIKDALVARLSKRFLNEVIIARGSI